MWRITFTSPLSGAVQCFLDTDQIWIVFEAIAGCGQDRIQIHHLKDDSHIGPTGAMRLAWGPENEEQLGG
jgi:hypothetical protein